MLISNVFFYQYDQHTFLSLCSEYIIQSTQAIFVIFFNKQFQSIKFRCHFLQSLWWSEFLSRPQDDFELFSFSEHLYTKDLSKACINHWPSFFPPCILFLMFWLIRTLLTTVKNLTAWWSKILSRPQVHVFADKK